MRIRTTAGSRRRIVHLSAGAVALLAPAAFASAASAASLHVNKACYVVTGKTPPVMTVTGSGFQPNSQIFILSGKTAIADGNATTDALGQFTARVKIVPAKTTVIPQTTVLKAQDGVSTATTKATVALLEVFHGGTRKLPGLRALNEKTKWQFSGFRPGRAIWGHYTIGKSQVARQRFGKAKGPCGTLTVHKVLYPAKPHRSSYGGQFDQSKKYSPKTKLRVNGPVSLNTEF